MTSDKSAQNCFTFLWKLENISYCLQKKGERIVSPSFVVDAVDETKWSLRMYPRGDRDGNFIACYLNRETDNMGKDKVEIKYQFAFVSKDGTILKSITNQNHSFSVTESNGYSSFLKREHVFISRRSEFLPDDTLTVRCTIWKTAGEMTENVQCSALTRIGVEKISFLWNVENFSSLELEKKYTYQITSVENDISLMSVDMFLTGGLCCEDIIRFVLSRQDQTIKFSNLRLFLIDSFENKIECNHDEFWFESVFDCNQFVFSFTKKQLFAKKSVYLPDDKLSLHWESDFSRGVVFNKIKEVRYGPTSSENVISDCQQMNNGKIMPLSITLNDNLKSLYDANCFCDIKLKTNSNIFPAHKVILSAYSSVFKAMFLTDMEEKHKDCVNIEDLSDDAVGQMLLYFYTARVENLTWESASDLYVAADKYAILCLKNICSSYLKENLSPSNACEALLLAAAHSDSDLKSAAQDYVLKHNTDLINSDKWEVLMETNRKLAAETLYLRYK